MAAASATDQAATSSSTSRFAYQVFLTFRGKDVGKTFISHLYNALEQAGIKTFLDDDQIQRGQDLNIELQKALEQSRISVVVFSKDYSSSRWCLDELVKIVDRMKSSRQAILPIFYDLDPSHVRKQTGAVGEAFAKHEEEFEAEIGGTRAEWMDRMKKWREALTVVANLGGKVRENEADGYEGRFIQEIIKAIGNKMNRTFLNVAQHPIGIDARVKNINLWIRDGSTEVGVFAIYGMSGIGKTAIAKTAYNLNFENFDNSSFLANIREESKQPDGLVRLQRQLLTNMLTRKAEKINNVDEGIPRIQTAVSCKRVLIVLDDVDHLDQINAIIGKREWFFPGSKIIITTKHEQLLKAHDVSEKYKVKELDVKESLQLFSWHAFGQDHPAEGYMELSQRVLEPYGGIPLAIQVLGSSMSGRSIDVWESAIKKLEALPDTHILKKLKMTH